MEDNYLSSYPSLKRKLTLGGIIHWVIPILNHHYVKRILWT